MKTEEQIKPSFESVAEQLLRGPWNNPDETRPINRPAMYALAVASHHLVGAMAQRQDCPSNTAREVEQAMWWLDEFANRLRESFTETPDRPA